MRHMGGYHHRLSGFEHQLLTAHHHLKKPFQQGSYLLIYMGVQGQRGTFIYIHIGKGLRISMHRASMAARCKVMSEEVLECV